MTNSTNINIDYIKNNIKYEIEVIHFESIDSTNDYCKYQLNSNNDYTVVIADEQTKGKGRLGRTFYSPKEDGLYMSIDIKPIRSISTELLNIITPVAVCDAIKEVYNMDIQIKWVNDLFYNYKKIGGILIESMIDPLNKDISKLVIGIGINLNNQHFPKELNNIATSLQVNPQLKVELIVAIINKLLFYYKTNNEGIIEKYKNRLFILQKEILYTINHQEYKGKVLDIDAFGRLIVQNTNGDINHLIAGEVSLGSSQFTLK